MQFLIYVSEGAWDKLEDEQRFDILSLIKWRRIIFELNEIYFWADIV